MTEATLATDRQRAIRLYEDLRDVNAKSTSRIFAVLMFGQWAFAIAVAAIWSPLAWSGRVTSPHVHLYSAVALGGLISFLPVIMAVKWPTHTLTRHTIAVAQILFSALLIYLSGDRIETHFHIFGSLAFLSFYRDWRVIMTATLVVVADQLLRGVWMSEPINGLSNPEWWRFFEHAFWVTFEDAVLIWACMRGAAEIRGVAVRQAQVERLTESERDKSRALINALDDLRHSHETLTRAEKLAAVGQLAAGVGHELRNPLSAVRNALTYVQRRILAPDVTLEILRTDKRLPQFFGVMDDELNQCSRIISNLLDFARERVVELHPCPLKPLVDDAIQLVPPHPNVSIVNEVSSQLPIPNLDRDQFRQVIMNLAQNAAEAISNTAEGVVRISAQGGGDKPWIIQVTDNGSGIAPEVLRNIFQPLFTTKTKGTGLGLAIVAGLVEKHGGSIKVDSAIGRGTTFNIELPASRQNAHVAAVV